MDLVYKANSSSAAQTLTSSPTLIDQDSTINQTATTTDIADDWTQNTGLLIQQSGCQSGRSIHWSFKLDP
ncbi:hypothetical protein [Companilactobacillus sp. FL22-1]|uniref:hypothetical protein n=1 Tax=Companilactobacillus sp. FL22-1 TaxID=3373892 RepID=UPI003754EA0A